MRKPLIIGNWKMNKTVKKAIEFIVELKESIKDVVDIEIGIAPSFTSLLALYEIIKNTNIILCAQNMYYEPSGAYTGEISPLMLSELNCQYVIVGHSERRTLFYETDNIINKKVKSALTYQLNPILCVGETLIEHEENRVDEVIYNQIIKGFNFLSKEEAAKTVVAYEPVWAIGTGQNASPESVNDVHLFIRQLLGSLYNKTLSQRIRIVYGGGVRPDNIATLMLQPDIDGVLVGGASLNITSFVKIINYKKIWKPDKINKGEFE